MKSKYIIFILLCTVLASCGEDRRKEYVEKTKDNRWIESMMRENYYWYREMPSGKKLNYFMEADKFFSSLLYKEKDKGYSYIEYYGDTEKDKSYGMEFVYQLYNDTAHAVRILYVDSDSPAKEAGLERGDWIIKRNGEYIIKTRIDSLYRGNAVTLTRGEFTIIQDENDNDLETFIDKDEVSLSASRITKDKPIHYAGIYTTGNGEKVGYLVYNHFTPGESENDFTHDNQLRQIANEFKAANITQFILDLRYNKGGSLESAQLLGSILAPETALGQTMCQLEFNDKQRDKNESLLFSRDILNGAPNLNLNKLYVITGSITASTSEILINSLKPYMENITYIGQTTAGNFAGIHAYTNEEYPYTLYPVDCLVYNANDFVPEKGFIPTHEANELRFVNILPFGNRFEYLLDFTLTVIETGAPPVVPETKGIYAKTPGFSTLDRVRTRGVYIK